MLFIVLPAVLYGLLRMPSIQTYITKKIATNLSKKLNTEITVGGVDISWFLDVVIEEVSVKDLKSNELLYINEIVLDVKKINFAKNLVVIDKLLLHKPIINFVCYKGDEAFNYQFLVDYFATDTTTTEDTDAWKFDVKTFNLAEASFSYNNHNKDTSSHGLDFNHLNIIDLNTEITDISVNTDSIKLCIKNLSFADRSHFKINKLNGNCVITSKQIKIEKLFIKTDVSDIALDLCLDYENYADFSDFVTLVKMELDFQRSLISLKDIAYFVPEMHGMSDVLDINGNFKGKVSNLKGRNIEFKTARSTSFKGNLSLMGLPSMDNTYINFNAEKLTTTIADLNSFILPGKEPVTLKLPKELIRLGFINYSGNFTGFISDFVAYGHLNTAIGSLKTDVSLKSNANGEFSYKGNVALNNFDLGKMLDDEKTFGKVSLDFILNGKGFDFETVDVELNGKISSAQIKDYEYKNISIAGNLNNKTFSGYIDIREKNIDLDFEGVIDMRKDLPVFDFSSEVYSLKLHKLNITDKNIEREVSGFMKCRFKGKTLEDISGIFLFNNLKYRESDKVLLVKNLQINNVSEPNFYKNIVVNSEIFDAIIEGHFSYTDIPASFQSLINIYLPSYNKDTLFFKDTTISTTFTYDIKIKSTTLLTQFINTDIQISDDLNFYGNFNYAKDYFTLDGQAKQISKGGIVLNDCFISGASMDKTFTLETGSKQIILPNDYIVETPYLLSHAKEDSILFDIKWFSKKNKNKNNGDVSGFLSFEKSPLIELKLLKADVFINDSLWVVDEFNTIYFDSNMIDVNDLIFKHNKQLIGFNGIVSDNSEHQLDIFFDKFDISDFNPILEKNNVQLKGVLSGKISLFDIYKSLNFVSDINISGITINGDKLGNLVLNSTWDKVNQRLLIDSKIIYVGSIGEKIPLKASGYYYPSAEKDNFDINIILDNFSLKLLENYLSSFSSDVRAFAYGRIVLKGSPAEPVLDGYVDLKRAGMKIDYLNTTITFSDTIKIKNNMFFFDSIAINDIHNSNTAIFDGAVYHDNFKNFNIDLNINMNNLMCLNTNATHNNMFYGTAFATGLCHIYGPVENIIMDIYAKTERNTKFYLPLDSPEEISENTFIKFINKDTAIHEEIPLVVDLNGIQLNFDLEVTSDAEVQIIFDSKIGDIIKAKGNGNLKMEISTLGDFNMFGDYIIEDGEYLFTLQNFINKRFRILKGSQISWAGDPYLANANVDAVYGLRTPLYDLVFSVDSSEEYKKRMPVNCLLGMNGNLFNPDISFSIDLPGSDEKTKNLVNTLINSEAEVNRQMFALLALNRFLPPPNLNEFSNISIGTGLEATSTELLSNQLSNWLSQISNDFDIGVNYRAGNEISSDEVEVALSTQLFNDRVSVDGSVGTSGSKQNTSQIVGDVNVEVKLTEEGKFRMKFYNKSNAVDMLKINAPYTQGIGLFYRREFDSFRELISKKK